MKSKKATRRALLSSALSLVLCFSMLLGTTFAWFTDSASTAVNTIQSGTLDVVLEYYDADQGKWLDAEDETLTFKTADDRSYEKILWEPGCTYELPAIRVGNAGNLHLKYQIAITGIDGDAELNEAIEWSYTANEEEFTAFEGTLEPATDVGPNYGAYESGIVISGHMKEDADNKYQGKTIDGIGITVYATQMEAEFDSFNNDYDAGAYLPVVYTAEELASALENNESVMLGADIDLTGTVWTPIGDKDNDVYYTGTLDGAGHKITGLNVGANDYDALISAAKDATIKNLTVEGTVNGVNAAGIVARVEGETVIENCVSNVAVTGTTKAGGIVSNVTGASAKIINCVNNGAVSCSNAKAGGVGGIIGYVNTNAYVEVINCTNNGAVTGTDGQTTGAVVGNAAANSSGLIAGFANNGTVTGKNYVGDSLGRWVEDENGLVLAGYCGTPDNWTVADCIDSAEDFLALSAKAFTGNNGVAEEHIIALTADIDLKGADFSAMIAQRGDTLTILGNGHTISNANVVSGVNDNTTGQAAIFYCYPNSTLKVSDLTLKNINVTAEANGTGYAAAVIGYCEGTAVLNNVDVVNATVNGVKSSGMLVGHLSGSLTATDCDVDGSVTLRDFAEEPNGHYAGKLIGTLAGPAVLNDVSYDVTVSGNLNAANIGDIYGRSTAAGTITFRNYSESEDGLKLYTDGITGAVVLYGVPSDAPAELTIPDGVTALGNAVFGGKNVTKVTIPASVTNFGASGVSATNASGGAFKGSAVTTVVLEDGMTEIPAAAFNGATNLTSVTIPSSVTTIGVNAFRQTALTELTVPTTVTNISYGAFRDMTSLTTVTFEGSHVDIPDYAFRGCTNLRTVNLKNADTATVGTNMAFANASSNNPGTNNITFYVKNETVGDLVKTSMGVGSYVAIYVGDTLYAEIN